MLELATRPMSLCRCGHAGDGPGSAHKDLTLEAGHGACTFEGCECPRFTWAGYTLYGRKLIDQQRRLGWRPDRG
jgi:hypothetical protein